MMTIKLNLPITVKYNLARIKTTIQEFIFTTLKTVFQTAEINHKWKLLDCMGVYQQ